MVDRSPKSAADKKAERSSIIEEQIKNAQKKRDERTFLDELAKRITIARDGKELSTRGEFPKALSAYRRFLSITAKSVNIEIDALRPEAFEEKSRKGESLLISSILFDMLKILDKLDTDTAREERQLCHRLFVRFTLNQPFQFFAAENLRKYLVYRQTVKHKNEFWATYHAIKVKKFCVIATWAFDSNNCRELVKLRAFRDQSLAPNPAGRAFIRFYYENGSGVVRFLRAIPAVKPIVRGAIRIFAKAI